jgi:hypothetical protein
MDRMSAKKSDSVLTSGLLSFAPKGLVIFDHSILASIAVMISGIVDAHAVWGGHPSHPVATPNR